MKSHNILIITDNLSDQINGVVTTYKNIERYALLSGYTISRIDPSYFAHVDCPGYKELKLSFPWNMGSLIEDMNPDYIHIATEGPLGISARQYLVRNNLKFTTAYHTKFPEALRKIFYIPESWTWPLIKWFHSNSARVLTTTDSMVTELCNHGFTNEVIPWTRGVDRTIFNSRGRVENKQITLVCVSRISKEKNLEKFFELDYPGARKIMVGDGPMLPQYVKQYPTVEFVGMKKGFALASYFITADVFVFPSRWETFGIVMIEAMACGTPVAAYPCQGPLDVINEGITGCMNEDLKQAITSAITLDRNLVEKGSMQWSWNEAWSIFRNNLVSK